MTPQQSPAVELVPVILEMDGTDELRFVPRCHGCGELLFDVTHANVAVLRSGTEHPLKKIGTYRRATVSIFDGANAVIFCWECDRKQEANNVPWENAALVLRDRNDAAQARAVPSFRSVTARVPR
jgi:hypothetical protein